MRTMVRINLKKLCFPWLSLYQALPQERCSQKVGIWKDEHVESKETQHTFTNVTQRTERFIIELSAALIPQKMVLEKPQRALQDERCDVL